MSNQRYIPPQSQPQISIHHDQVEQRPSFRGAVSDNRVIVFGVVSILAGAGLGYMVWRTMADDVIAIGSGVLAMFTVFASFYVFDSFTSTGWFHKRLETNLEIERLNAAAYAVEVNYEQQEQIEQLWVAINSLSQRLDLAKTVTVTDLHGSREVPIFDNVDAAIDQWLSRTMFDANGLLIGVWPKNMQLRNEFPFKGDSAVARQARARILASGLLGKAPNSNNYTWEGPPVLSEALAKLSVHRGRNLPEV